MGDFNYDPTRGAREEASMGADGSTIEDEAHKFLAAVMAGVDDPQESGRVYASEQGRWRSYMLAGNGPTVWVHALFGNANTELGLCFLTYSEWSSAAILIPDHFARHLILALENDRLDAGGD